MSRDVHGLVARLRLPWFTNGTCDSGWGVVWSAMLAELRKQALPDAPAQDGPQPDGLVQQG